jgi:dolichol-phosphate mannosyltransferase
MIHWVGFRQIGFPHKRNKRLHGDSSADLLFCMQFALNALFVSSIRPLRWASLFGLLMIIFTFLGMIGYTAMFFLSHYNLISLVPPPPGWTTMILALFFFGGVQSFFLGLLGEYLGRVYIETKQRPLWVLKETAGFPPSQDPLPGYKKT